MSITDQIVHQYEALTSLPGDADGYAKRQRGYAFERLLKDIFVAEALEPRIGCRPTGEQIDGSIYLDGRVYLLEAKWHADPIPASMIYQFKGKVDGKLAGTLGVFISMSAYAEDAIDALVLGKALNIILFDMRDIDVVIRRRSGFKSVMKLKLRKAAEEGAIYFPSEAELVKAGKSEMIEVDRLWYDSVTGKVLADMPAPASADLLIVCEGEQDRVVISVLCERILRSAGSMRSIKIIVANGNATIPRVANAARTSMQVSKMLIVSDGDNKPERIATMLANGIEFSDWVAAIPNPSIESWLGIDRQAVRRQGRKSAFEQYRSAAMELDMEALRSGDGAFAKFYDAVAGS